MTVAERLVYHWKHGWIPLTHAAALSKAHGNSKLADKYVHGTSSHHADRATAGKSARQIHNTFEHHARITARPGVYRGESGHNISGTDTRGRRVQIFVPGDRAAAQRTIDNLHAGREPFHTEHPHLAPVAPGGAPRTPGEAFKMGGPELKQHAASGSSVAQSELDRRAAKRGDRPKAPVSRKQADPAPRATTSTAKPEPRTAAEEHAAENARLAPAGHTIVTKDLSSPTDKPGLGPRLIHTQFDETGARIGSVVPRKNGQFGAMYKGAPLEEFDTRQQAHNALAAHHAHMQAQQRAAEEARATKAAETAAAAQRRAARASSVGVFQPHVVASDGTPRGDAAAAKIKQSFKFNDHTVHIEAALSKDQTKALLGDIHSVLLKSGHMNSPGITFHVPTGDKHFRAGSRRGTTGGYVRQGQRTIFINPKVASGSLGDTFGGVGVSDNFMPAARATTSRQYVLTHELGHILDNQHSHTRETTLLGSRNVPFSSSRDDVASLKREHKDSLSKYGNSSVAESYAEAYAQWIHGGPGSSAAADAYALKFGWENPKWYREGRAKP